MHRMKRYHDMSEDSYLQQLAGALMDHDCGLLEPSLSSYNHLATVELPRVINNFGGRITA